MPSRSANSDFDSVGSPFFAFLLVGLALMVGFLFSWFVFTPTADAYTSQGPGCGSPDADVQWHFDGRGGTWTASEKVIVRIGIDNWNVVEGPFATLDIDDTETSSSGVDVFHLNWVAGGWGGSWACVGEIALDIRDPVGILSSQIEGIVTHEAGHAHGLRHTGKDDSFGSGAGTMPTMTGCVADSYQAMGTIDQDDYAQIVHLFNTDIHANSSFENGKKWWGDVGSAKVRIYSGGAADGDNWARLYNKYGAEMYQTIRYTDPTWLRLRINTKEWSSVSDGYVWGTIYAKEIQYDTPGSGCAANPGIGWPNGWDLDDPTLIPATSYSPIGVGTFHYPDGSWNWQPTIYWEPEWDGIDMRIRIFNHMYYGTCCGSWSSVKIDHARAYGPN